MRRAAKERKIREAMQFGVGGSMELGARQPRVPTPL
jgi:hypothetical protein